MRDDHFERDDRKAAANVRKHGISFHHARRVFNDPSGIDGADDEEDEERFSRLGMAEGFLLSVIYAERSGRIRVISARRATKYEQNDYASQKQ